MFGWTQFRLPRHHAIRSHTARFESSAKCRDLSGFFFQALQQNSWVETWGNRLRRFPQTPSWGFFPLSRQGNNASAKPALRFDGPAAGPGGVTFAAFSTYGTPPGWSSRSRKSPTNSAEEAFFNGNGISRSRRRSSFAVLGIQVAITLLETPGVEAHSVDTTSGSLLPVRDELARARGLRNARTRLASSKPREVSPQQHRANASAVNRRRRAPAHVAPNATC